MHMVKEMIDRNKIRIFNKYKIHTKSLKLCYFLGDLSISIVMAVVMVVGSMTLFVSPTNTQWDEI